MGVVSQNQVGSFTIPSNATTADADQVRGNDNTIRAAHNAHDGDATIHLQSGLLTARPTAGSAGRVWFTTDVDGRVLYFDDGTSWAEADYAKKVAPTITGPITLAAPATINASSGSLTFQTAGTNRWAIDSSGHLASSGALNLTVGGNLTVSGLLTLGSFTVTGQLTVPTIRSAGSAAITLYAGGALQLGSAGVQRWSIDDPSGSLFPAADNTYDIGAQGSTCRRVHAGSFRDIGGLQVVGARRLGWGVPTGTLTRTTFVTSTVTLPQLAERVAALIADLEAISGHGLLGT